MCGDWQRYRRKMKVYANNWNNLTLTSNNNVWTRSQFRLFEQVIQCSGWTSVILAYPVTLMILKLKWSAASSSRQTWKDFLFWAFFLFLDWILLIDAVKLIGLCRSLQLQTDLKMETSFRSTKYHPIIIWKYTLTNRKIRNWAKRYRVFQFTSHFHGTVPQLDKKSELQNWSKQMLHNGAQWLVQNMVQ